MHEQNLNSRGHNVDLIAELASALDDAISERGLQPQPTRKEKIIVAPELNTTVPFPESPIQPTK